MNLTELQKEEIKKWEQENWFYTAKLQEECISYEHYVDEVLLCISENKLTKVKKLRYNKKRDCLKTFGISFLCMLKPHDQVKMGGFIFYSLSFLR